MKILKLFILLTLIVILLIKTLPLLGVHRETKSENLAQYFEEVAADIEHFSSYFGSPRDVSNFPPNTKFFRFWTSNYDAESRVLKNLWLISKQTSVQDLEKLLKNPNPKVRTLALYGLFHKADQSLLPLIYSMVSDTAETWPQEGLPYQNAGRDPDRKQTVGEVAASMVSCYVEHGKSSHYYNVYDLSKVGTEFERYWESVKDRKYDVSWFAVWTKMASENDSTTVERVRSRINRLPPDERAWMLLCMLDLDPELGKYGDVPQQNMLASEEELVKILQELGPEKLLAGLRGNIPLEGMDWRDGVYRRAAIGFILQHAVDLFRPQDADALLTFAQKENATLTWLAAASLNKGNAPAIIHQGLDSMVKAKASDDRLEPLVLNLWKVSGENEAVFLVDWFYGAENEESRDWYAPGRFIDHIVNIKEPSGKKLLARILTDPRSERFDSYFLAQLAEVINKWVSSPVLTKEEIEILRGRGGKGVKSEPQMIPGTLEKLQKSIPEWNS